MGNNTSTLPDSVIDDSPILTTQDWSLHHAESTDHGPLSVFIGQKSSQDSNLCLLAKGLKSYRHPSILKYYAWAPNGNQIFLFTEKACPISLVRTQQNPYSTGLGIFQICQAIKFLHETGEVTHGNLKENSIFITPSGDWKLAGLENVHKISEPKPGSAKRDSEMLRDILALGILITELLAKFTDSESQQFLEYAKSNLLLPDLSRRPNISQVLEHSYFQQEYIQILQYLKDLTLKTDKEKEEFFLGLGDRLMSFPQQILGQHFAAPLLSRYVMMDLTARSKLIPRILQPQNVNPEAIFSQEYFSDYVVPEIKTLFLVYDYSIRLILLENFNKFSTCIDNATLEEDILPSLILGLKDTNPVIVSETLRSLADIVPILGPEKVIGKNIRRVFSDGSPQRRINKESINISWSTSTSLSTAAAAAGQHTHHLRVPPVGAETEEEDVGEEVENLEEWDNWGEEEENTRLDAGLVHNESPEFPSLPGKPLHVTQVLSELAEVSLAHTSPDSEEKANIRKLKEVDILNLDVKVSSKEETVEEVDFFADMTPDIPIKKPNLDSLQQAIDSQKMGKFAAVLDEDEGEGEGDGWGDDW